MEGKGVPFVVPEDGERRTGLEHGADQTHRLQDLGAPIQKVAHKDRDSMGKIRVAKRPARFSVTELD